MTMRETLNKPWSVLHDNEAGPGWDWCVVVPGHENITGLSKDIAYRVAGDHNWALSKHIEASELVEAALGPAVGEDKR